MREETMTRDEIIDKLKTMEPELRARGVTHMQIFGSRARGDGREDSDLDLLVEIDPEAKFSLLDLSGLHLDLTEELGIETFPTTSRSVDDRFRREIAADLISVF
jgi:predicted nucleotidyltransferase